MTAATRPPASDLLSHFADVRSLSEQLCDPLEPEDCMLQSMPDASPIRWHLAHTTWFFETFVLLTASPQYRPFDSAFEHLFNSYYNSVGEQFPRAQRGLISRPTVAEVFKYRTYVDEHVERLLSSGPPNDVASLIALGLQHEQQHQELMLTDLKHAFHRNPLCPVYQPSQKPQDDAAPGSADWIRFSPGLRQIGHSGDGFAFDNETPRHKVYLEEYRVSSRPVTNAEFTQFIDDGGYRRPEFWLSEGWHTVQQEGWTAPLYWQPSEAGWSQFTLAGLRPLDPNEPVCHVSYFEADAFARWHGSRLPTEAEWEAAADDLTIAGNFIENGRFQPAPAGGTGSATGLQQMFGDVWEWTGSQYSPYPGFRPAEGALGEYNGKFMCNQFVLRGGSCATSRSHIRSTYRNFFPPSARWQFSGIRLAR